MGTWDIGPFENDTAADFAGDLDEATMDERGSVIRRVLERAADPSDCVITPDAGEQSPQQRWWSHSTLTASPRARTTARRSRYRNRRLRRARSSERDRVHRRSRSAPTGRHPGRRVRTRC
ncbi:DUF4259 domain-containing protein [Streptomyces sp. NPDC085466]|uniref:DUF4259 domain-containing protein n=1 Tax=Streptomyces sp. NPDC085466 TaxID=3365725 RepID=UPI0037D09266